MEVVYMCVNVYCVYVVWFLCAWVLIDLSRIVQKYNCTQCSKSAGVTKAHGEPEEKSEGINACIQELEYWVISLEDDVHEYYGTLLSPLR